MEEMAVSLQFAVWSAPFFDDKFMFLSAAAAAVADVAAVAAAAAAHGTIVFLPESIFS